MERLWLIILILRGKERVRRKWKQENEGEERGRRRKKGGEKEKG